MYAKFKNSDISTDHLKLHFLPYLERADESSVENAFVCYIERVAGASSANYFHEFR